MQGRAAGEGNDCASVGCHERRGGRARSYLLEFLDLKDEYSENDLEEALIRHLEWFLLEMGTGFTFVARQKRIRVGNTWYRIDLLLYHRALRCLVVVESRPAHSTTRTRARWGAIPKRGDFDSTIRSLPATTCDKMVEDPRNAFNFAGKIHFPTTVSGESSVSENLAPDALEN